MQIHIVYIAMLLGEVCVSLHKVLSIWNLTISRACNDQSSIDEDGIGEMESSGHTLFFTEVYEAYL